MTIEDLRLLLVACAGEPDAAARTRDFSDLDFAELGYDSLALMETTARIEDRYGLNIPEYLTADLRTPREIVALVNELLEQTTLAIP